MREQLLPLERCEICKGAGRIRGIFHLMECAGCNGGGFVRPGGEALDYPTLVQQLRLRLARSGDDRRRLQRTMEQAGVMPAGAEASYCGNNKKGAGGAHFTGD